jgi:hypothetical protein
VTTGARGKQTPRIQHLPPYSTTAGSEAIDLARHSGLVLDPWQQYVLINSLGERDNGTWTTFEVGLIVSRQNGKGAILEARELAGLFLFNEQLIIHTSHEFKTSLEAFGRIRSLVENTDDLRRKVRRITVAHGSESIELMSGAKLRFLARTKGSGRGFSCDCLIMDEAMILGSTSMAALLPTMSARKNPQVWYTASAGIGEVSSQLAQVRDRGIAGRDESLAFFEWSADVHSEHCLTSCREHMSVNDHAGWLEANPGVGYRITMDYIGRERAALGPAMFARERLGVGDYPAFDGGDGPVSVQQWEALTDVTSEPGPNVAFAVDVGESREWATIALYSLRPDDVGHCELIDRRTGTEWIADRLLELKQRWNPIAIGIDGKGPAGSLLAELESVGITSPRLPDYPQRGDLVVMNASDMVVACGQFADAVKRFGVAHVGDEVLLSAVGGAVARPVLDSWAWARRKSTVDISPLVAVTLARYAYIVRVAEVSDYNVLDSAW